MLSLNPRQGRDEVTTISADHSSLAGPIRAWVNVWRARGLLYELTSSSIRTRYKNSKAGLLWSFARPLVQLLIYYFAIGEVLGVARSIPDFAIFVFVGLTVWGLFNELITSTTTSILNNAGIVKKVYFPRELFPLMAVGTSLFSFLFQFLVLLVAVTVFTGIRWSWDLLLVPFSLLTLVVFAYAIGLFLAAVNVRMRDVQHFVEVVLSVMFWASPIVYALSFVQEKLGDGLLFSLYTSNPVTLTVLTMQRALWNAGYESGQTYQGDIVVHLAITLLVSLIVLFLSHRYFIKSQGNFAQEL